MKTSLSKTIVIIFILLTSLQVYGEGLNGKIIKIFSDRSVVINLKTEDGIKIGDRFSVMRNGIKIGVLDVQYSSIRIGSVCRFKPIDNSKPAAGDVILPETSINATESPSPSPSSAPDDYQTAMKHFNEGLAALKTGNFPVAFDAFNTAHALLKQIKGTEKEQAGCLSSMAMILSNTGKYKEGMETELKAFDLFKKIPGTDYMQYLCCMVLGQCYSQTGDTVESRKYYLLALQILDKLPASELERAGCYQALGWNSSDNKERIYYINKALDQYNLISGRDKEKADCLYSIGLFQTALNLYKESISSLKKALKLYEGINNTEMGKARCYKALALDFGQFGEHRYENCIIFETSALEIYQKIPGTEREKAGCYKNIGAALGDLGKYDEAVKYQNIALEMYKKIPGTEKEQADCSKNIYAASRSTGRDGIASAQSDCEKADSLFNQGLKLYASGDIAESFQCWLQALEMYKRIPGTEKGQADCYSNIGVTLRDIGKYEECIKSQKLALELYERIPGAEKAQADCSKNIGLALEAQGKHDEAVKYLNHALEMYKKMPGTEKEQADCSKNISAASRSTGRDGTALAQNDFQTAMKYFGEGLALIKTGNFSEAFNALNTALTLLKQIKGTEKEQAGCLSSMAMTLISTGKYKEGIETELKAFDFYKKIPGTDYMQYLSCMELGQCYDKIGDTVDSRKYYLLALQILDKLPASELERAGCYQQLGWNTSDNKEKIYYMNKALEQYNLISGRDKEKADCLYSIGLFQTGLNLYKESISSFKKALTLYKGIEKTEIEQAKCYSALASNFGQFGEHRYENGIIFEKSALEMYKKIPGTEKAQANCYQTLGVFLYDGKKDCSEGLRYLLAALKQYATISGTEKEQAICHKDIGNLFDDIGKHELALTSKTNAMGMLSSIKGAELELASCLIDMSTSLSALGFHNQAIKYNYIALDALNKMPKSELAELTKARCYNNIGAILGLLDKYEQEIQIQNLAIDIYKKYPGMMREEATCYRNIAYSLMEMGEYKKCIKYATYAQELYKRIEGLKGEEGACYGIIGDAFRRSGETEKAYEAYKLSLQHGYGWWVLLGMALTQEKRGECAEAYHTYEKAINSIEKVRQEAKGREAKIGLFEEPSKVYSYFSMFLVNLYKKGGINDEFSKLNNIPNKNRFLDMAFQFADSAKARAAIDIMALKELKSEPKLLQALEEINKQITQLHQTGLLSDKTKEQEYKIKIETLLMFKNELQFLQQFNIKGNKHYLKSANEFQKEIPPDLAVLEYVILPEETLLFVLKKDTLEAFHISINSSLSKTLAGMDDDMACKLLTSQFERDPNSLGLEGLIKLYRQPLEKADFSIKSQTHIAAGQYLADLLVPKEARNSLSNIKHLLIVPDGILSYLPFNALIMGARTGTAIPQNYEDCRYLIEDYAIRYTPSLSFLDAVKSQEKERRLKRTQERKKLIAFADPVFDNSDSRAGGKKFISDIEELVTRSGISWRSCYKKLGLSFARLPDTKDEAESIAGLFPEFIVRESPESISSDKPSIVYTGLAATDMRAKSPEMKDYRYILFSTHGLVDAMNPGLSCIALTDENSAGERGPAFLKVEDFFSMDLDADLITLSACQTGLGRVKGGEGMVGFSTALFYAEHRACAFPSGAFLPARRKRSWWSFTRSWPVVNQARPRPFRTPSFRSSARIKNMPIPSTGPPSRL